MFFNFKIICCSFLLYGYIAEKLPKDILWDYIIHFKSTHQVAREDMNVIEKKIEGPIEIAVAFQMINNWKNACHCIAHKENLF